MNVVDGIVWFVTQWIPSVIVEAVVNYFFFWFPLAGVLALIIWLTPKRLKKRVSDWLNKPTLYEKHQKNGRNLIKKGG